MATKAKGKPAMSNGAAAVKALGDAVTGGDGTVEVAHAVTLQGRPVTVHLSVEEVARYLVRTRWTSTRDYPSAVWHGKFKRRNSLPVYLPTEDTPDDAPEWRFAIEAIAQHERRHPLDVVADIHAARSAGR